MDKNFDIKKIKINLEKKELVQREANEQSRQILLKKAIDSIKELFEGTAIEVFLVGSIVQPNKFTSTSDVDIVLKNFKGDRLDIWTKLEGMIERDVEIILFETCHFQDHILKDGKRII